MQEFFDQTTLSVTCTPEYSVIDRIDKAGMTMALLQRISEKTGLDISVVLDIVKRELEARDRMRNTI
jgi:hypothetical protein